MFHFGIKSNKKDLFTTSIILNSILQLQKALSLSQVSSPEIFKGLQPCLIYS